MSTAHEKLESFFKEPDETLYLKVPALLDDAGPGPPGGFSFQDLFLYQAAGSGYIRTAAALLLAGAHAEGDAPEGIPYFSFETNSFFAAAGSGHAEAAELVFAFWAKEYEEDPGALHRLLIETAFQAEELGEMDLKTFLMETVDKAFIGQSAFNEDYLTRLRARAEALAAPPPPAPSSPVP